MFQIGVYFLLQVTLVVGHSMISYRGLIFSTRRWRTEPRGHAVLQFP